jgi:hypothetical protein
MPTILTSAPDAPQHDQPPHRFRQVGGYEEKRRGQNQMRTVLPEWIGQAFARCHLPRKAHCILDAVGVSSVPRTRSALINAAAFIRENSYGRAQFTPSDQADAQRYMTALARGDLAKYLWGDGDESEGG